MNQALSALLSHVATPAQTVSDDKPHQHAVENGVIRHLSVSQVKDFTNCERIWFLSKVRHLKKKRFKSQDVGIDGHKQIEHYLKTGQNGLGPIALAGLELLPAPGADLGIEAPLEAPPLTAAGLPFEGYIDIINPRRAADGVLRLTDHKFSKDIDKWAAKPEHLISTEYEHGIQMIGYARWAVLSGRFPWVHTLELEHIYYQTQNAKRAEPVLITVPASSFDGEWERVERTAERMQEVARAESLADVKPNWSACDSYGGCTFKAQCLTYKGKKPMGVMDLLNKKPAAAAQPAPAAAPQPEAKKPSVIIDESTVPDAVLKAKHLTAAQAQPGHLYILPDGKRGQFTMLAGAFAVFTAKDGTPLTIAADAPLIDSPAPSHLDPRQTPGWAPPPPLNAPKPELVVQYDPGQAPSTPTTTAQVIPPDAATLATAQLPAATDEKPKRTRRTKEQIAEDDAAKNAPKGDALVLYVDAVPNGPVEPLANFVGRVVAQIQEAFPDVVDIRCAPSKDANGKDHMLAFGKWKGVLAGAIKAEPPPAGAYCAIGVTGSELLQVAVEALEPLCAPGNFIRGVR